MAQGGRTAIIVGSGFGGLSTAIRLLSDGWQVTILEARPEIGGRASRIQEGGYTFDTGPSLITMPWLFEEVYAAAGEKMSDHVTLRQLQPGYRIFWTGEDRHFDFGSDREQLLPRCASSRTTTRISSTRSWPHRVRSTAKGSSSLVARTS